jgi:prophage maintenance system killer protein
VAYIDVLQKVFDTVEQAQIDAQIDRIHLANERLGLLSQDQLEAGFQKLAIQRRLGSSSLKRGESEAWIEANQLVQKFVDENRVPDWKQICRLNQLLTNQQTVIRHQEIYMGPYQACPIVELNQSIEFFQAQILESKFKSSLLIHAALCQYWLVSLHPFNDANGRTSVLLTDWFLALNDYLPQSFTSKADSVVAYQPGRPHVITPGLGVIRVLKNILNSYRCFVDDGF